MFEKFDSLNDYKSEWLLRSASFAAKFWIGFCLNAGKRLKSTERT